MSNRSSWRLRLVLFGLLLAIALVLAACGGAQKRPAATRQVTPAAHRCDPNDFIMQCAAATPPNLKRSNLALPPAVAYGIDFGWREVSPATARALGARFAFSYLSLDGSKNWSLSLVRAYHAAGLTTGLVWETTANRALGGRQAGIDDARRALSQAAGLGAPSYVSLYFAVDFDTTFTGCGICAYFSGAHSVLGSRTGAYGGLATGRTLLNNHLVNWFWQTSAWSSGIWDGRAVVLQTGYTNAYDTDRATRANFGQWPYAAARPVSLARERQRLRVIETQIVKVRRQLLWSRRGFSCRQEPQHHGCAHLFAVGDHLHRKANQIHRRYHV